MSNRFDSKEAFVESFKAEISKTYGRDFEDTYRDERYVVLGNMIRDYATNNWRITKNAIRKSESKQLYYFSMEFLMGRLLTNNLTAILQISLTSISSGIKVNCSYNSYVTEVI